MKSLFCSLALSLSLSLRLSLFVFYLPLSLSLCLLQEPFQSWPSASYMRIGSPRFLSRALNRSGLTCLLLQQGQRCHGHLRLTWQGFGTSFQEVEGRKAWCSWSYGSSTLAGNSHTELLSREEASTPGPVCCLKPPLPAQDCTEVLKLSLDTHHKNPSAKPEVLNTNHRTTRSLPTRPTTVRPTC